ncbi:sugar phosphate permease [Saccharopolyspora erythraea NRRL 2338]|uniref:MFS transporter n=2 Tax=Saccharopolyspora erythraea TaxID=1836 RepID=A4FLW8_SACEN|nr:MFS transporter [Saccharopolyspora erythraea]EQD88191.1 MFS transporter [Saccharopolyspora erythraea D]PFG98681.1 sugar phosphate permease [Saccharopolyspora erythraea NRRL 2338]QRK88699.1 MFS transporter [Saccharopolyspora erythraea]CAM05043.1 putative MFS transporter [Saccharopolyspora erythraea NRRL 2338]
MPQPNDETLPAAVRRVMWRLMPFLFFMYVIAFLDRVNIGFAKEEFQAHAGISEAAYALGAGLFFIGYALFEVPSNLIMQRVGARWWMCRIMVTWGLISAAMALVDSEGVFYLLRFLLGVAEAGFFPGVILFITHWVPHAYRARCNALFYLGIPLASVLGGPLSGLLLELDGTAGILGWQWMFAVEGLIACVVGVWAFFYLDNKPADARWLSQPQRDALQSAVDLEAERKREHSPHRLLTSLVDPRVLYFSLVYFLIQCAVYGMTFYLPTQVSAAVGSKVGLAVGLVTAIPWTVALLANLAVSSGADRVSQQRKRFVAAACACAGSVGIAASAYFSSPVLAICGLAVAAAGYISVQPVFWTFPAAYLTGTAAAAGIGLINSLGNLGGFVAPVAKNWVEETFSSDSAGLYMLSACGLAAAALFLLSSRLPTPAARSTAHPATEEAR